MKKNDLILAAVILVAAACVFIFQYCRQDDKKQNVKITVDGNTYGVYSLTEDQTIRINDTNRLIIRNGEVYMDWADCPDQICVRHHAVSKDGESIICLPNKVVVAIESTDENDLDGIVQ